MDKNIQRRVQELVDSLCGGNKSQFARCIGRDADAVKDIVGGRGTAPGYSLIYDILSSDFCIDARWLILGEGEMLIRENSQVATVPTASYAEELIEAQRRLLRQNDEIAELKNRIRELENGQETQSTVQDSKIIDNHDGGIAVLTLHKDLQSLREEMEAIRYSLTK